jgi:hypothetical protein
MIIYNCLPSFLQLLSATATCSHILLWRHLPGLHSAGGATGPGCCTKLESRSSTTVTLSSCNCFLQLHPAAIFSFWGIFLGSIVLGVLLGLAAAALLRSRWYHGEVNLETGLMLLLGYASYMAGAAAGGPAAGAVQLRAGCTDACVLLCSCCCCYEAARVQTPDCGDARAPCSHLCAVCSCEVACCI